MSRRIPANLEGVAPLNATPGIATPREPSNTRPTLPENSTEPNRPSPTNRHSSIPTALQTSIKLHTQVNDSLRVLNELSSDTLEKNKDILKQKENFLLENFSSATKKQQMHIADYLATNNPLALFNELPCSSNSSQQSERKNIVSSFSKEEDRLKLAIAITQKWPDFTYFTKRNINAFHIENEKNKLVLLKEIAKQSPFFIAKLTREDRETIDALHPKEENIFEFAKFYTQEHPDALAQFINNDLFKSFSEEQRFTLAKMILQQGPENLLANGQGNCLANFQIKRPDYHIELAQTALEKNANIFRARSQFTFEIPNEHQRGIAAFYYCQAFKKRLAQGQNTIEKLNDSILKSIKSKMGNERFDQWNFAEAAKLHPLTSALHEKIQQSSNSDLDKRKQTIWLIGVANKLGERFQTEPEQNSQDAQRFETLQKHLEYIKDLRMPVARFSLGDVLLYHCILKNTDVSNAFIQFDQQFSKAHTKPVAPLLFVLHQNSDGPLEKINENLKTLIDNEKCKDKSRQAAILQSLLTLTQSHFLDQSQKRQLLLAAATLPPGDFKNNNKEKALSMVIAMNSLKSLLDVASEYSELSVKMRDRLVGSNGQDRLENQSQIETALDELYADVFALEAADIQILARKLDKYNETAREKNGLLFYAIKIRTSDLQEDDKAAIRQSLSQFLKATVLAEDANAFSELRYDASNSAHLRTIEENAPSAFSTWKTVETHLFEDNQRTAKKERTVHEHLFETVVTQRHVKEGTYKLLDNVLTQQMTLEKAMQQLDASSLENAPQERQLLELLNPTQNAEQKIALIDDIIPNVHGQFKQDLTDLKQYLNPPTQPATGSTQYKTVFDTDAPEDLFLCGTEVIGSCQNIHGEPNLNKALMGYVLDGKYRALVAKSGDGKIVARRMLRMLWDDQTKKPVLQLEQLYHSPGVSNATNRALMELAKQKATRMGAFLVTHNEELKKEGDEKSKGVYPRALKSLSSAAPFEYVDALRGTEEGKYEIGNLEVILAPENEEPST